MKNQAADNSSAKEEALRRVFDRETYTTPFAPMTEVCTIPLHQANTDDNLTEIGVEETELDHFLEHFSVRDKTEEIVEIMGNTPRLKTLFEELVPTVISYSDFWTRFYFRCDPDRIMRITYVDECKESRLHDDGKTRRSPTPVISSPTSVADHFDLEGLQVLRNLSLEGL